MVAGDHARQEQVWDNVSRSGFDEPYQIRRMLTENTGPRIRSARTVCYSGGIRAGRRPDPARSLRG
jgi:hypothetical protein